MLAKAILRGLFAVAVVAFAVAACHGEFIVDFEQSGSNVAATGSGTLNLTALTYTGFGGEWVGAVPDDGYLLMGTGPYVFAYSGLSGPQEFGRGAGLEPSTYSGALRRRRR